MSGEEPAPTGSIKTVVIPVLSAGRSHPRPPCALFLSNAEELTELMDPEEVHELIADCLNRLSACVTRWGGCVDRFIGDGVMAIFGAPVAYENEAERAVRGALDIHKALDEWSARQFGGPGEEG